MYTRDQQDPLNELYSLPQKGEKKWMKTLIKMSICMNLEISMAKPFCFKF